MAEDSGQEPNLRWLEAGENPFGMRVLDCRPLTQAWLSTTVNPQVLATFARRENAPGLEYRGKTPDGGYRFDCDIHYPFDGKVVDGPLFLAQEMEDKWNIYSYEGVLYFARSWTGDLMYTARIEFGGNAWVTSVSADIKGECPDGAPYPIRVVDFLIKSHLHRQIVPHPLPMGMPDDPMVLASFSMWLFGRRASFATFEDTTMYNPWTARIS
jgi:hypothetical protein